MLHRPAFLAKTTLIVVFLTGLIAAAPGSAMATPVLQVTGGKLIGALGVEVNGALYDVAFLDGSCNSLFGGCTNFTFQTDVAALAAAQALLDSVLVNGSAGSFDSLPALTAGCSDDNQCNVVIPFPAIVRLEDSSLVNRVAVARNLSIDDSAFLSQEFPATDYALFGTHVWAVFTPAASVPEPGTLTFLGLTCAALGFLGRRPKRPTMG